MEEASDLESSGGELPSYPYHLTKSGYFPELGFSSGEGMKLDDLLKCRFPEARDCISIVLWCENKAYLDQYLCGPR